ncbi:MAG: AtpZ/AtpI family protein [Lachnospiraceae bacterium]|nr:AtpZ/AtpI family protein [Lachnospiraceae bacterium]
MADYIPERDEKKIANKVAASFAQILQFSLYMLVPICGMTAAGYYLDKRIGTSWLFIAGFIIGAIAGFQNIYRYAMKITGTGRTKDPGDKSPDGDKMKEAGDETRGNT